MRDTDLFLHSEFSLKDLAQLLGAEFDMVFVQEDDRFVANTGTEWITLQEHDFVNDGAVEFDRYRYNLEVRTPDYDATERLAWQLFERLKATKRFPLMLVGNLQMKLAEYAPPEQATGVASQASDEPST